MKSHAETEAARPLARRVLVVEDHPIFREGIAHTINREAGLMICGEAATANHALELVNSLRPDLVLIDITLPGKSGIELIKDIHAIHPEIPLFVLSMHEEALFAERVLKAGARAYMMKQESPKALIDAIQEVLTGGVYLSAHLGNKLIMALSEKRAGPSFSSLAALTDREFEVFRLIGRGCDSGAIARELHLSPKTVAVHKSNIKQKLKIGSSTELMRYAIQWDSNPAHASERRS